MNSATRSSCARRLLGSFSWVILACALSACARDTRRADTPDGAVSGDRDSDFYTTTYLSEDEALDTVFPDASRIVKSRIELSDAELTGVSKLVRERVRQRSFDVFLGLDGDGTLDGYAIVHQEIGKFKLITFIVSVEPNGKVRRVAVMVYRESRGGEVARRRFLVQYDGKTIRAPISMNRDIINISGATMSVRAMNRGVKKVLAVVQTIFSEQPGRLENAIAAGREVSVEVSRSAPHRASRLVMGSLCSIEAYHQDPGTLRRATSAAFDEIERIDGLLSDYRVDSELSRLSREGARADVPISPVTAQFLREAASISASTEGSFDLTIAPLLHAWGFRDGNPRQPSREELERLRELVDYRGVQVLGDESSGYRARLAREGMRLDPGGLGKGFAVDRAVKVLETHGIRCALINFSGCIYALGAPPRSKAWRVAVRDPSSPNKILGAIDLRDEALSTSGGYERHVEIDGERRSHILSPLTLEPRPGVVGAIVRAPTATWADGWSTAATVLGEDAITLLEEREELDGVVALRSQLRQTARFRVNPLIAR